MLHLRAREARPERLRSWKGRYGNFVRTFLINDQRNKNGWRVTWSSIRNHAKDFVGQPGIEYTKWSPPMCQSWACLRHASDHA